MLWQILEGTRDGRVGHFFFGGREGVAETLASRVVQAFPDIRVAGTFCPPFRALTPPEEDDLVSCNRNLRDLGVSI